MHRSEFEKFASDIRPRLAARALSITSDEVTSEDIVQNCLLKMWTIRDTLDDYSSPEALALTIVHRMAINEIRSRRTQIEILDDHFSSHETSAEEKLIAREKADKIELILSQLPESQQAIIRMRHIDGLSNSEIALIIGSSEGSVRTALSRARNRVAELFIKSNR